MRRNNIQNMKKCRLCNMHKCPANSNDPLCPDCRVDEMIGRFLRARDNQD